MGGSLGFERSQGTSRSDPQITEPGYLKEFRKFGVLPFFESILRGGGSQPGGLFQSIFQNYFGGTEGDFLNAQQQLEDALSGANLSKFYGTTLSAMRPEAELGLSQSLNRIGERYGSLGLQSSSDRLLADRFAAADVEKGLAARALAGAVPLAQQQSELAFRSFFEPLQQFLPLLLSFAGQFPPVGTRGRSDESSFGINASASKSGAGIG